MYLNNITKPLPEKYIHSYIVDDDGGIRVIMFVPYLMKSIDDPGVNSLDDDTTYMRIEGKMNEWELSIFVKIVLRDSGHLRSVMNHNDSEYSGIPNETPPEQVAPEFFKLLVPRKGLPSNTGFKAPMEQHARLSNFVYIESAESLAEFSAFVRGLGVKKIQDWWVHKEAHPWIIPCLVKSQSRIPPDVWGSTPSTTNTNEAQHAWTTSITGTGRSLVEAVEGARNARESQELSDATKDLEAKIADELEKRRESSALTKDLKEKLVSLKGTGEIESSHPASILSASSSGRMKSTPLRGGRHETHSFPTHPTGSGHCPGRTASRVCTHVVLDINSAQPVINSFDIFGVNDEFNWDVFLGSGTFGRGPNFNTSVALVTPPSDPLQDFIGEGQLALNETFLQPSTSAIIFDLEYPTALIRDQSPWPLTLPLLDPLPESSVASPVAGNSSNDCTVAVWSRAKRRPEIDVNLILPDTLSHSMAPSSRKRPGEEPVSRPRAKKQHKA
ncbi:hypothetical protein DFH08DRAFT_827186 [Mycena albidolilacea]|uniref:Uncharacterized protein n=1 Tax=Mycena albidolilacea TaxID=1033008 RepID=A0AAD6YYJ0_9AGAR|nr:hypothetical protein DFH08DRAFT_827186 [Mycena albidolilacea]